MLSDIVNVFIGLAMTFAAVSLVATAVTEGISSILSWRSRTLLTGLKQLLNDPDLTGLAAGVLNHAAANPRASGADINASTSAGVRPSYIPPQQFASALIDVIQSLPPKGATAPLQGQGKQLISLNDAIKRVPDPQIFTLMSGISQRTDGDVKAFKNEIAIWFDNSMDRVSGAYKRRTQLTSFLVALALVVALDINLLQIIHAIWGHPQVVANASDFLKLDGATATLDALRSDFPFGWGNASVKAWPEASKDFAVDYLTLIATWILTAMATLLGAPFWFDTLTRFVQVAGTGPKPGSGTS